MRGAHGIDVAQCPVGLPGPLAAGELPARAFGQLIDHRPPDRAGELGEIPVHFAEVPQLLDVQRVGIVLVENDGAAVVQRQRRVADRPVAGPGQ